MVLEWPTIEIFPNVCGFGGAVWFGGVWFGLSAAPAMFPR